MTCILWHFIVVYRLFYRKLRYDRLVLSTLPTSNFHSALQWWSDEFYFYNTITPAFVVELICI